MSKSKKAAPVKAQTLPPAAKEFKKDLLKGLLVREAGASIEELTGATGWQPHTTRAALTGLRKSGLTIEKDKVDGVTRYRSVSAN
jgi:hypothetical protein